MSIWVIVAIVALGLLAILLEPFVPTGGILGVLGAAGMCVGVGMAYHYEGTGWGTAFLLACLILAPAAAIFAFKIFPSTPVGRRLILKSELSIEDGFQSADPTLEELAGQEGVTITMLRPVGFARFGNRRVDVVTDGELIEKGERVLVIEVEGSRVVVEKVQRDA